MTCPLAPKHGHRPGSRASLTCPYCNPPQLHDRRSALRARLLPSTDERVRTGFIAHLDSLSDNLETDAASRGKKANWLCPSLTGWANNLEGSIFASFNESQLRAELIRRHCPLWLARTVVAGTFQLQPELAAAIPGKSSISLIMRLFAVWVCPIQDRCVSYQENIFKLTFEGIVAQPEEDPDETSQSQETQMDLLSAE